MSGPTRVLEDFIYKAVPQHNKCYICDSGQNGVATHILGQNHYKGIWRRLGTMPEAMAALSWTQPWVERFPVGPQRVYLFNHVTGEQGWEHEVTSVQGPARPTQPAQVSGPPASSPPPQPASSPPVVPDSAAAVAAALAAAAAPPICPPCVNGAGAVAASPEPPRHEGVGEAAPGLALDHFHWRCIAAGPAAQLRRALAEHVAPVGAEMTYRCGVCDSGFSSETVEAHLGSTEHFAGVRRQVASFAKDCRCELQLEMLWGRQAPWVQSFAGSLMFNHLTLELSEVNDV